MCHVDIYLLEKRNADGSIDMVVEYDATLNEFGYRYNVRNPEKLTPYDSLLTVKPLPVATVESCTISESASKNGSPDSTMYLFVKGDIYDGQYSGDGWDILVIGSDEKEKSQQNRVVLYLQAALR